MTLTPLFAQVLLPGLLLSGCGTLSSCQKLVKGEQQKIVQAQKIRKLIVRAKNGSLRISQGKKPVIDIHATIQARTKERLEAVQIHAAPTRQGDFEIYAVFPGKRLGNESCSFTIKLPSTQALDLETSNGSIYLNQLDGPAKLRSSNGTLRIFDHRGPLDLRTSNGGIQVRNADRPLEAHSSNGKIDVLLEDRNPGPVQLHTSNGYIHLKIGEAFQGRLHAQTSNGSIRADLPQRIQTLAENRRTMSIRFPKEGQTSQLTTRNGSILIERR